MATDEPMSEARLDEIKRHQYVDAITVVGYGAWIRDAQTDRADLLAEVERQRQEIEQLAETLDGAYTDLIESTRAIKRLRPVVEWLAVADQWNPTTGPLSQWAEEARAALQGEA